MLCVWNFKKWFFNSAHLLHVLSVCTYVMSFLTTRPYVPYVLISFISVCVSIFYYHLIATIFIPLTLLLLDSHQYWLERLPLKFNVTCRKSWRRQKEHVTENIKCCFLRRLCSMKLMHHRFNLIIRIIKSPSLRFLPPPQYNGGQWSFVSCEQHWKMTI